MNDDDKLQPTPEQSSAAEFDATPPEVTTPTATEQPAQVSPETTASPISSAPVSTVVGAAPKKSKKKWIIASIIGVVLVLLIGGSVAAYNLWYQNPDKVLSDAFVNAVKAKSVIYTGTIDLEPKGATTSSLKSLKITIDGKSDRAVGDVSVTVNADYNGKDITVAAAGLYDKDGNLFIKLKDVRKTLEAFSDTSSVSLPPAYDTLITKIDNKWVKFTKDDLSQYDEDYKKDQECMSSTIERLQGDAQAIDELATLYKNNKFIVVKENLGSKDGSLGYLVEGDEEKAKSFAKGLNDTKAMKELQKCDKDLVLDEASDTVASVDSSTTSRVEVWVDGWSHQLTSVKITGDSDSAKGSVVINTQFDAPVSIEAPTTDVVTYAELKAEVEKIFASQYQQYTGIQQQARSTSARVNASYVSVQVLSYRSNHQGQLPTLTQLKSELTASGSGTVASVLTSSLPSSANPNAVQYRTCGTTQYEINYYDATTARVVNVSGMTCTGNTST